MRQGPRHTRHRRAPRRSNEQLESYGVDLASVIPNDDGDGIKDRELPQSRSTRFLGEPAEVQEWSDLSWVCPEARLVGTPCRAP